MFHKGLVFCFPILDLPVHGYTIKANLELKYPWEPNIDYLFGLIYELQLFGFFSFLWVVRLIGWSYNVYAQALKLCKIVPKEFQQTIFLHFEDRTDDAYVEYRGRQIQSDSLSFTILLWWFDSTQLFYAECAKETWFLLRVAKIDSVTIFDSDYWWYCRLINKETPKF